MVADLIKQKSKSGGKFSIYFCMSYVCAIILKYLKNQKDTFVHMSDQTLLAGPDWDQCCELTLALQNIFRTTFPRLPGRVQGSDNPCNNCPWSISLSTIQM